MIEGSVSTILTILFLLSPLSVFAAVFPPSCNFTSNPSSDPDWHYLVGFILYSLWHWTILALFLGFSGFLSFTTFITATALGYAPLLKTSFRQRVKASAHTLFENVCSYLSSEPTFPFVLFAQLCVMFYIGLTRTPQDYDTMAYHLPFIAEWVSNGKISLLAHFANGPIGYYPSSWEALTSLFFFPFRNDTLFQLPGLITYILMLLVLSQFGLHLGVKKSACVYPPLLLGTLPITQHDLLYSLHVDFQFSAFILTSVLFLKTTNKSTNRYSLAFLVFAISLAVSTKSSGIMYIPLLLGAAAFLEFWNNRSYFIKNISNLSWMIWILIFIGFAAGSSWYVRNFIYTGNPLGVLEIKILGFTAFAGRKFDLWRTTLAHLFNPFSLKDCIVIAKAFLLKCGIPFLSLIAISAVFSARKVKTSNIIYIWVFVTLSFLLYWISPYSGDNGTHDWTITLWIGQAIRYGYTFLAFCTLLITLCLSSDKWSDVLRAIVTLSVGFSSFFISRFAFGLCIFGLLLILSVLHLRPKPSIIFVSILISVIALMPILAYKRIQKRPAWLVEVYGVINKYKLQNVAVLKSHRSFAAYGDGFQTKVKVVGSVNQALDLIKSKEVDGIFYGPNTIPKWDTSSTFTALTASPDLTLAYDVNPKRAPAFFISKSLNLMQIRD